LRRIIQSETIGQFQKIVVLLLQHAEKLYAQEHACRLVSRDLSSIGGATRRDARRQYTCHGSANTLNSTATSHAA
jgi:hypothetical protein